jgi:hypothetical protein
VTTTSSPPKIYRPKTGGVASFAVVMVLVTALRFFQDRSLVTSIHGLVIIGVVVLGMAYIFLFGTRLWVFLYDTHLALHPRLAKLIKDRFGVSLYTPKVIYYRQIKTLRRSRGLGGFNALAIMFTGGKRSELEAYGIPYLGVENYADLEAELLRRVPPTCELCGIDILFRKRPFK